MENYHPNRQTPRLEFIYGYLTVPYLHVYAHAGTRQGNNITSRSLYKYIAYQLFIHIRKYGNRIYCFLEKEKGNNCQVFNYL